MNKSRVEYIRAFPHGLRKWFTRVIMLVLTLSSSVASAGRIECAFDVNDTNHTLIISPKNDIFERRLIDLPGGYRFAGQYLSELNKFKAYIYHTPKDRYVLISLQEFNLTAPACMQDFGKQRIYDSADERELFFHCKKTCDQ